MFVKDNSLTALKAYFSERLSTKYSEREISIFLSWLVMERFHINRTEYLLFEARFSESDLLFFRSALKRLQEDEPIQYILGWTEFDGLRIHCDSRGLIPRPETEELVYWISESSHPKLKILDLCSGTGCIGLALKNRIPESTVYAMEFSEQAIGLLEENKAILKLDINIVQADVLSHGDYSQFDEGQFDVWVSNPPYIPESDRMDMKENVLKYEPEIALFVQDEPLEFYEAISEAAMKYLKRNAWLYFEIHEKYGKDVEELLAKKGFVNIELRKDLQGKDRMIRAQR